jgi:hypothetical protein
MVQRRIRFLSQSNRAILFHVQRRLDVQAEFHIAHRFLPGANAVDEVFPVQWRGVHFSDREDATFTFARDDRDAVEPHIPLAGILEGEGAFVTVDCGFGNVVVCQCAHDYNRKFLRVIKAHIEGIGHFTVIGGVFENAAGSHGARRVFQTKGGDKRCKNMREQIRAGSAGVVEVLPPTEKPIHGKRHFWRVA